MPICYHIELSITRHKDDEEEYETTLPGKITVDEQLTPEQLEAAVAEFWENFASFLGATGSDTAGQYIWDGIYLLVSIFNC